MLTPQLIRDLDQASEYNGDDHFFAIMSEGTWFVFNWAFGLSFPATEIMNCPHFSRLREEADRVCNKDEDKREVIEHMSRRSWIDILVGTGLYMRADCTELRKDEVALLKEHKLIVTAFETEQGRRFYVKDNYLDIANEALGDDFVPTIFRPISSPITPNYYRPMIFFDVHGTPRGLCSAISEDSLRHPIDRSEELVQRVERLMPEMFGASS